jgi:hypothetical protein
MTVSTTTIKNSAAGNGSNSAFSYTFKAFASSEVKVYVRTDSTGAEVLKTEGTGSANYAVSGIGAASGGTVTFVTAPASGETVVIRRLTSQTQGTDYVENDPFAAEDHETALDKLTHIVQEVQEEVDRSFKVSKTNSITTPEFVDDASTRASRLLGFSSDGNTLEATTGKVNSVSVSNVAVNGAGASQAATVSYTDSTGALALGIPVGSTGATGAQGPSGAAATIAVGSVTTGSAGSSATINNAGSSSAATFNFSIPQGAQGVQGNVGPQGPTGPAIGNLLTTRGDIVIRNASEAVRLGIGSSGRALLSDGTDPSWGQISLTAGVTGTLPLANGGTGSTSLSGAGIAALASDQTFTAANRGTITTDNDGSLDLAVTNNWKITTAGNLTLTFTNISAAAGQSGNIIFVNASAHTISLHSNTKGDSKLASTISSTGTYWLSYISDGTNVYVTTSAVFA